MTDVYRDSSSTRFGLPSTQPHPSQLSPVTSSFASPVLETPRPPHASLTEFATSSTPHFAEEYSVFNTTPGNLQASQLQSGDSEFFSEFAPQTSPNSRKRLPSLSTKQKPAKRVRRGNITKDPESNFISPPPTAHKGEQKFVKQLSMQYDQSFPQPEFTDTSQSHPHDVAALMANSVDMFPYPSLSAPLPAHPNPWDPQASADMDFDFASHAMFSSAAPNHRQSVSFDWNNDIQLFQDANLSPLLANQENIHPQHQQHVGNMFTNAANPPAYHQQPNDAYAVSNGEMMDPSIVPSQPNTNVHHFTGVNQCAPLKEAPKPTKRPQARRNAAKKATRASKNSDSTSPLKHPRGALDQANAGTGGRGKLVRSNTLPTLLPAACPVTPVTASSVAAEMNHPTARPNVRQWPAKSQQRPSSLASIYESSPAQQRTSVRFTIDARGRARAETLTVDVDSMSHGLSRSQSSRNLPSRTIWDLYSDSESEDDDLIVIPSRTNSFNASFALPDPRKPVGCIFHRPRRSTSDRSSSSTGVENDQVIGDESETETLLNEHRGGRRGDAASELVKLVENRQKRLSQPGTMHPGQLIINLGAVSNDTISPSSLVESGYCTDEQRIRCVCKRSGSAKKAFMVQCESCESWLHGKCIGISKRTMTNVYICAFCANTTSLGGQNYK